MEENRMIDEGNPNNHGEEDTKHHRILNYDDYEYDNKTENGLYEKYISTENIDGVKYDIWAYMKHNSENVDFYKVYHQPDGKCLNSGDPFYDFMPDNNYLKQYILHYGD